jgi:glycine cleavage system H protein
MSVPSDLRYLQTHEWHRLTGDTVTIGITQNAADELTDVTYVSLPKVGTKLSANGRFGEIESVKATSDLYSGVAGTVTEVNGELADNPGLVNTDPYTKGWMLKVKLDNRSDFDKLLSSEDYRKKTGH